MTITYQTNGVPGSLDMLLVTQFRTQGYILLPKVFDEQTTRELNEFLLKQQQLSDTAKIYKLYQKLKHHNPDLAQHLVANRNLVNALASILGPNIVYLLNRHNQGSVNSPGLADTRMHRDILNHSRGMVTCVVYAQDSDTTNGATTVIPGSHLLPQVGTPQPDGGGTWMNEHPLYATLLDQGLPVLAKAGDVLVFDGMLFHAPGHNQSTTTRSSAVFGYRSVDELGTINPKTEMLVAGKEIYRGNDRAAT